MGGRIDSTANDGFYAVSGDNDGNLNGDQLLGGNVSPVSFTLIVQKDSTDANEETWILDNDAGDTASTTDNNSTVLKDANSFAYMWVHPWGSGDDWDAVTVTSITFEGSNLVVPTVIPEPSSLLLLALGAVTVLNRRRRALRVGAHNLLRLSSCLS